VNVRKKEFIFVFVLQKPKYIFKNRREINWEIKRFDKILSYENGEKMWEKHVLQNMEINKMQGKYKN
jgi:hypothetical protein